MVAEGSPFFMHVEIHPDVEVFLNSLDTPTIAKALRTIDLLENFGPALRMPHIGLMKMKQLDIT